MSTTVQSRGRVERRPDLFARFQAALPLLILYFAFAALYSWQASRRPVPTTFTDELELTQISRAIAATGHAARRGEPYHFRSLYLYMIAPLWWIDDVALGMSSRISGKKSRPET